MAGTIHRLADQARSAPGRAGGGRVLDGRPAVDETGCSPRCPAACRLILLGDTDQLASVEPGSVFSDLCAAGSGSPLAPCIVRLTRSHRFAVDQGIGLLAAAVVRGDAEAALATLSTTRAKGRPNGSRWPAPPRFDRFCHGMRG